MQEWKEQVDKVGPYNLSMGDVMPLSNFRGGGGRLASRDFSLAILNLHWFHLG